VALQYSVAVRNANLDAFETTVGASAILEIRTGSPPADCATASSGTLLALCSLPADWMNAASGGTKTKNGTWQDTSANGTGTAGYFRIFDTTGTTCHAQGTVTLTGGGGDMTVDNTSFVTGQAFSVTTFTLTSGNA
jgi:hypothetical protein